MPLCTFLQFIMIKTIDLKFQGKSNVITTHVIDTAEGPVIFDPGPFSTIKQLEAGLAEMNYTFSDVKNVFLTHIHFDHAGACWYLAEKGATIYLHPKGFDHMKNPEKLLASAKRIYGDKMEELWGEIKGVPEYLLFPVSDKTKIRVGKKKIKGYYTPGHAPHHIAWQIDDSLICGDVAGVKIGDGIVVPPCPPPNIDIEAWQASIRMIRLKRYSKLYLSHAGMVDNPKNHLVELNGRLKNWANWIKPHFENNTPVEEVVPAFQEYVARQLEAGGATQETIELYEQANPSWMSVQGLMRYWQVAESLTV